MPRPILLPGPGGSPLGRTGPRTGRQRALWTPWSPRNSLEASIYQDGPAFLFPCDDTSQLGYLLDIVGGRRAYTVGAPTFGITGPVAGFSAVSTGNVADYWSMANDPGLQFGNVMTLEVWVAPTGGSGTARVAVSKGQTAENIGLWSGNDGFMGKPGTTKMVGTSSALALDGTWHQIAFPRSGTGVGNTLAVLDGVDLTVITDLSPTLFNTVQDWHFGHDQDPGPGAPWIGGLAYIVGYNYAVPVSRLLAHVQAIPAGSSLARSAADSVTYGDAATRSLQLFRSASDGITFADAGTRTFAGFRAATDGVQYADAAVKVVALGRSTTDAVQYADAATRQVALGRAASDGVTQGDVAARVLTLARSAADALTRSDAATRAVTLGRAAADAVTQADAATRTGAFARSVADAVARADVATRAVIVARSSADAVARADVATRVGQFLRAAADAIQRADVATQSKAGGASLFRTATDAISRSDVATRAVALGRAVADALTRADQATRQLDARRAAADSVTYIDVATSSDAPGVLIGGPGPVGTGVSPYGPAGATGALPSGAGAVDLPVGVAGAAGPVGTADDPRPK